MGLRAKAFLANVERVLGEIRSYAQSPHADIPASQLVYMAEHIERMRDAVLSENLPASDVRYAVLSPLILDTWPLGHPLGNAISELEAQYEKL